MYALALWEVFLRLEVDFEGGLEEDLEVELEVEMSFFLKKFFIFFSSSES